MAGISIDGVDHRFGHPLRLCEKPYRAKAQRLRSVAETMINAQSINWFQAVKIKIRPVAFVLPLTTPKKSQNMSLFFLAGIFFLRHSEEVSVDLFASAVWPMRIGSGNSPESNRG
jgi:hypothetical protein